jgi:hypothetical protein
MARVCILLGETRLFTYQGVEVERVVLASTPAGALAWI